MLLPLVALPVLLGCHHAQVPKRLVVDISELTFKPPVLEVAMGDTVVWINHDIFPHTATEATAPGWDTGALNQGEEGRFVADRRGERSYHCTLHPTMEGKLVIR